MVKILAYEKENNGKIIIVHGYMIRGRNEVCIRAKGEFKKLSEKRITKYLKP